MFVLAFAALMLAAASPTPTPALALASATPWWERFTFTMVGDGDPQGCEYQSSVAIPGSEGCGSDASATKSDSMTHSASSSSGSYTKITIERRYTPGTQLDPVKLQAGDTLLGEQVLSLLIDSKGAVSNCRVIGSSGKVRPPYGCDEARTEQFDSSVAGRTQPVRQGLMTVLVYGHEEYPV
jgi:hypothetical protein